MQLPQEHVSEDVLRVLFEGRYVRPGTPLLVQSCQCDTCCNKTDNAKRSEAINETITRDPFAFVRNETASLALS